MRKLVILITILMVVSSIFTSKDTVPAAERTNFLIWIGWPEVLPVYEQMKKDYEAEHPEVKIETSGFELREFERKLALALPTDTGPDIIQANPYIMQKYIETGYIPKNPGKVDAFAKSAAFDPFYVPAISFKGDTYGLPWLVGRHVMFWNKTMFKEAGLTRGPKTYAEMLEYSRKLAKYDASGELNRSGVSLRLSGAGSGVAEKWWMYLYPLGGTVLELTPGGKYRNGYNNPAGREALKLYIDLLYKYHVDDHKIKHDAEAFALERTAMFVRESWVIGYMKKHAPQVQYDTVPIPSAKRGGDLINWENIYISKTCKNPEIGWDFVLFAQRPKYVKLLLSVTGWLPGRKDVDLEDIFSVIPQYRAFLTPSSADFHFYRYYPIICSDEIYTKLAERLVKAFLDKGLLDNEKGIVKVIEEAAKETDDILKEYALYGAK